MIIQDFTNAIHGELTYIRDQVALFAQVRY